MAVPPQQREVSVRSAHICTDILYEIPHGLPCNKVQNRYECSNKCHNPISSYDEFCIRTVNKLSAEITHEADQDTISRHIQNGIFTFGIDLFYGSVQQNIDVVTRLREAAYAESQKSGFPIPLSIYLKISPRYQYTGALSGNNESFSLKLNAQVVLSTDRRYASQCSQDIIYVNARFLLMDVQKCDVIRLGEVIQLQVVEVGTGQVKCTVIAAGEVRKRMPVYFPRRFDGSHLRISVEELEDMTFAIGSSINVIVTNSPILAEVRLAMTELQLCSCYLFTRLTLADLENREYSDVKWMIDNFDGFLLDCTENVPPDSIVKLPTVVHRFFKEAFARRRPLFLAGCWSMFVAPADYKVAFYYPDKFILPCRTDFLHLYEAMSHKFALKKNSNEFAGSCTVAGSIAAASFDFTADAILVCPESGRLAEEIAHHRPATPIIAVTSVPGTINYGSMQHNLWMLHFDECISMNISPDEDIHQKLVHGIQYATKKGLIDHTSKVILVYPKFSRCGLNVNFVVIKIRDDYVEVMKKIILDK